MNDNNFRTPLLAAAGSPIALLIIFASLLAPFFLSGQQWAQAAYPYTYSVGAVCLLLIRLFTPFKGDDLRLKRLHRIESWSAIFFCVGAFFLFYNPGQLRDWIAFTLAGAALQIFTSLAIPARQSKLKNGKA